MSIETDTQDQPLTRAEKISKSLTGRTLPPSHREAISIAKTGTKHKESTKALIGESSRGRVHDAESRDRISKGVKAAHAKRQAEQVAEQEDS